ncbi:hypothetical protein RGU70_16655 [Herbaspirillum sp. RTI4]|uniref:hypothetical protein n=1 Tax=Herbaspirillum sp. RTI4 TaxID=3048640 RepID=UPI002AB55FB1|nr:hypothetical protein [Herbaspirillum sp. RTI4]MDY7579945.1 hypothetical protein [Herbaspirillum sp. RTI4]MEA9982911.1 hypothetical protein [Herbaspirillum sp. RTI4]
MRLIGSQPCAARHSDRGPDWQPWGVFFLRSLAEQVRGLEKKIEREKIVLPALPELSLQIVESAAHAAQGTLLSPGSLIFFHASNH